VVTRWPDAGRGEYFGADGLIVPQPRPPAGAEYPTSEQNDAYMALVRLDYDTAMTVAQQVVWRICHLGYFAAERIRCEAITGNVGCDWETASDPHDYQRRPDEDLAGREFGWAFTVRTGRRQSVTYWFESNLPDQEPPPRADAGMAPAPGITPGHRRSQLARPHDR
jgi:hypothetical protein